MKYIRMRRCPKCHGKHQQLTTYTREDGPVEYLVCTTWDQIILEEEWHGRK